MNPSSSSGQHPYSFKPSASRASAPSPSHHPQPTHSQPQPAEASLTIPLTITIGRSFHNKLPFLIGLILFFSFSMIMFDKSNLKTMDLSDLQRVDYNIPKLYSLSFILFMFLIAFSLALAIYYSLSLRWAPGLLVVPATFLPSLLLGLLLFPHLLGAFVVFATVTSFAAIVSSVWHKLSISRAWAVLSASMLLFTVLAFFVVFSKVSANKDAHINNLLDTALSQAQSGLAGGTTPTIPSSEQLVAAFSQNSTSAMQMVSQLLAQYLASAGAQSLKTQIYLLPSFKMFYDRFAFISASIAALVASFVGFFIQVLALLILFGLERAIPMHES